MVHTLQSHVLAWLAVEIARSLSTVEKERVTVVNGRPSFRHPAPPVQAQATRTVLGGTDTRPRILSRAARHFEFFFSVSCLLLAAKRSVVKSLLCSGIGVNFDTILSATTSYNVRWSGTAQLRMRMKELGRKDRSEIGVVERFRLKWTSWSGSVPSVLSLTKPVASSVVCAAILKAHRQGRASEHRVVVFQNLATVCHVIKYCVLSVKHLIY